MRANLSRDIRMKTLVRSLRCVECEKTYSPEEASLTCPACGDDGILDVLYDMAAAKKALTRETLASRPLSIWRYQEVLPVDPSQLPPLAVGWTPIYDVARLAREVGVAKLWVKDDGRGPTASFKDRASAVGVARAMAAGARSIACASTGNAATSLAGFSASAGLDCRIFVPETAPEPKLVQLLAFGATVYKVRGTYENAYDLSQEGCRRYGWYNRNCAINPYLVEGKKTAGLEVGEALGRSMPDWVSVAVGDGCTIAGIWKGIRETHELGLAERLPRMLGVQAEGAAPIAAAFRKGTKIVPSEAKTIADSIRVGTPRNGKKALLALAESRGAMATVSDEEILAAIRTLGSVGVFAEPAASAAFAGVVRAVRDGTIQPHESVLVMVTGNGLKDVASARKACPGPVDLPPDPAELERHVRSAAR